MHHVQELSNVEAEVELKDEEKNPLIRKLPVS